MWLSINHFVLVEFRHVGVTLVTNKVDHTKMTKLSVAVGVILSFLLLLLGKLGNFDTGEKNISHHSHNPIVSALILFCVFTNPYKTIIHLSFV